MGQYLASKEGELKVLWWIVHEKGGWKQVF
jgi:hypothetical protein